MTSKEKLTHARTLLVLDHQFFGSLALRLPLIEITVFKKSTPAGIVYQTLETMATDGESIYYNPNFIDELDLQEAKGVLAHEVMHLATGTIWRQETREHEKWNIATDYVINGQLLSAGLTLPKGAFTNSKYDKMSAEEVYNLLPPSKKQKQSQGNIVDPGRCGAIIQPKGGQSKTNQIKAEWQAAVAQALEIAKVDIPAELARQCEEILDPPLPWYVLLRDFVERSARNDYSWSKPNSRYFSSGIILPSLISEELPEIVIAIDTSGSISNKQLAYFGNEVSAVFGAYETKINVIYCDSRVGKVQEFTRSDLPIEFEPVGGGGTDFRPVFDYVRKNSIVPACLIYFTDMYGDFPDAEPEYPVMWISTTKNIKGPFGATIEFDVKGAY